MYTEKKFVSTLKKYKHVYKINIKYDFFMLIYKDTIYTMSQII